MSNNSINILEKISPDFTLEGESENEPEKEHYKAARYNAINYVKKSREDTFQTVIEDTGLEYNLFIGTQGNLSKFMRHSCAACWVQRFESSKKAFDISLDRMIHTSRNILNWIAKRGKVPIFKKGCLPDIEAFYKQHETSGDELFVREIAEYFFDTEVEKFEAKRLFKVAIEYFEDSFVEDQMIRGEKSRKDTEFLAFPYRQHS